LIFQRIVQRLWLRLRQNAADRKGLMLFGIAALVAFVFLSGRFGGAPSAAGVEMSPPATAAAAGTPEAAIQVVILRGNQQQERAIASRNPGAMRESSTDAHYGEMAKVNQEMIDAGIRAIRLLKIEWGQIEIRGNRATATVWETWSTTLPDGSTEESPRDRNVYQLVQVAGEWKIDADEHPDSAPAFPSLPNPFAR
jgi:hypothetical protein